MELEEHTDRAGGLMSAVDSLGRLEMATMICDSLTTDYAAALQLPDALINGGFGLPEMGAASEDLVDENDEEEGEEALEEAAASEAGLEDTMREFWATAVSSTQVSRPARCARTHLPRMRRN